MTTSFGPGTYNIGSQAILPATPEAVRACSITRQDLDILLEGSGAGTHRAHRDLMLGVFVSALFGAIGIVAAIPDDVTKASKISMVVLVVLIAATIASGFIVATKHFQAKREEGRASFQKCKTRLERMLDGSPV
ncbi:hypothetical protein HPP05_40625 [Corallococcus exiguus]|uniref:hypothetical protein n=1 Tax=Corallococcus exiguus TaxID=83462 RepID=UPI001494F8B5|nr:hypothetical protein [Corallococcus exiguus]NPC76052.1 hypothetical protein [Corallococcus exiguus]